MCETMVYLMKFKVHIGPHQAFVQDGGIGQEQSDPAAAYLWASTSESSPKSWKLPRQKTAGIADASVGIDKAREDDIRNADIFPDN